MELPFREAKLVWVMVNCFGCQQEAQEGGDDNNNDRTQDILIGVLTPLGSIIAAVTVFLLKRHFDRKKATSASNRRGGTKADAPHKSVEPV